MARLISPEAFEDQLTLLGLIRAKHIADGAASVLTAFLAEQGINLNTDFTTGNSANTNNTNSKTFARTAESNVEQRDNKFNPVMKNTRGEVQFLKSFYKPNYHTLGDWGVTVDGVSKIVYPPKFEDRVTLVRAIKTKHDSYAGGTSPLLAYLTQQVINIGQDATATNNAETFQTNQLDNRRDSEEETEQRDIKWNPVVKHLKDIGDFLMNLFNGSQKKLGEWGFTVDDSPRAPKVVTITLLPDSQKTTSAIVLGGTFTNTGTVSLVVYKGKTATGTGITVLPNEKLGMNKGFSVITTVNLNTLEKGKFTVLKHQ